MHFSQNMIKLNKEFQMPGCLHDNCCFKQQLSFMKKQHFHKLFNSVIQMVILTYSLKLFSLAVASYCISIFLLTLCLLILGKECNLSRIITKTVFQKVRYKDRLSHFLEHQVNTITCLSEIFFESLSFKSMVSQYISVWQ